MCFTLLNINKKCNFDKGLSLNFASNIKPRPGPLQTSQMESFATMINSFKPLAIVTKLSILHVCGVPGFNFSTVIL